MSSKLSGLKWLRKAGGAARAAKSDQLLNPHGALNILVIGGGGREHAIVRSLGASQRAGHICVALGNGGTLLEPRTENVVLDITQHESVVAFCTENVVELVVIGPEAPLVDGLADSLRKAGIPTFGPGREAARLEGSKTFAKSFMVRHEIPTAAYKSFTAEQREGAYNFIDWLNGRVVVKADGLAAGKGVVVAGDIEEARSAVNACFSGEFGSSGQIVVIEERLEGPECSMLAFVDGTTVLPLPLSQDHKRAHDGDKGPNTGGMGVYSPVPQVNDKQRKSMTEIMCKTAAGLAEEGIAYQGVLYGGFMLTPSGPKVLEFNVRFGDPETQVILPRIKSDLADLMYATATGELAGHELEIDSRVAVGVVVASAGYPEAVATGHAILGLGRAQVLPGVEVYHAATKVVELNEGDSEKIVTTGGRVACITALADTFEEARAHAYEAIDRISFEGMWYRHDIGLKAFETTKKKLGKKSSGKGLSSKDSSSKKPSSKSPDGKSANGKKLGSKILGGKKPNAKTSESKKPDAKKLSSKKSNSAKRPGSSRKEKMGN